MLRFCDNVNQFFTAGAGQCLGNVRKMLDTCSTHAERHAKYVHLRMIVMKAALMHDVFYHFRHAHLK